MHLLASMHGRRNAYQEHDSHNERIGQWLADIFLYPPGEVQDPEEGSDVGEAMELLPPHISQALDPCGG